MKQMKRVVSLLLCFVLVLGLVPAAALTANAASETTYVLAASDFQHPDGHTYSAETIATLSASVKEAGYYDFSSFLFAGDYCISHNDKSDTEDGIESLMDAISGQFSSINSENTILVQGNHDYKSSMLSTSGENDTDDYGIFVINEDDYMDCNTTESTIKATGEALNAYLDAKVEEEYTKPIFVISHLPLHYGSRTARNGDGKYAHYLFDPLNEAGAAGLNIIFLYGHNHAYGYDNYLGGYAVYLPEGDYINIAEHGKTDSFTSEKLNFTYMNAGFTGYHCDVGWQTVNPERLSMTVFEITDGQVKIHRFNQDGEMNLKVAGNKNGEYDSLTPDSLVANTAVYTSPQTISWSVSPEVPETTEPTTESTSTTVTVGDVNATISGATITASGALSDADKALLDAKGYEAYVAIDVTATVDDTATVSFPIPSGWDTSRIVGISVEDGVVKEIAGTVADGNFSFSVTHFSAKGVALAAETDDPVIDPDNWVELEKPSGGTTTYTYELATSITAGEEYVIVGNNRAIALMDNDGDMDSQSVTISGTTMTSTTELTEWTFSGSSSGTVYNGTRYLRYNNSSFSLNRNNSTTFTFTDNGSNFRIQSGNRSFYYNGSNWARSSSKSAQYVRLYQLTGSETTGGTNGLYGTILGTTAYSVPKGTAWEDVEALVKEGITVYYTDEGNTATTGKEYADDGEGMSWTCDNYDANTPGEYTVTIAYNGVTLGTATVTVLDKVAQSVSVSPTTITVERDTPASTVVGEIVVNYGEDGTEAVDLTLDMLEGTLNLSKNGTYSGLSVTYAGKTSSGITVNVVNKTGVNDFPTYPNPGSVEVEKTAKGEDFQNTGLARVELSTSGLPSERGVDVVVVLDMSSSMISCIAHGTRNCTQSECRDNYRVDVLRRSLLEMIEQFNAVNPTTGKAPDIELAIIDFNGYGPEHANLIDNTITEWGNTDYGKVYTGVNEPTEIRNTTLSAANFVSAESLKDYTAEDFVSDNTESGTNYDDALKRAYYLLDAKAKANTESREQFVIFMSDGAPFGWNGINEEDGDSNMQSVINYYWWNEYLAGNYETLAEMNAAAQNHSTYKATINTQYEFLNNTKGGVNYHRWAEAIKGNRDESYTVFDDDRVAEGVAAKESDLFDVNGLGATIYSIGFSLKPDTRSYGNYTEGPGVETMAKALKTIASEANGQDLYQQCEDETELTDTFKDIAGDIAFAATNAAFVDQMGSDFDLQMNPTVNSNAASAVNGKETKDTTIRVTSQSVYTAADAEAGNCEAADIGKAYGTPVELETVTFTADANDNITATSSVKSGNILVNGVIEASTFFYNTTGEIKTVTLKNGSTYQLPGETFYWDIGTINEKRYTLSYMVYLTGSMDGKVHEDDSYETNNYANLNYTNHVGNEVSQSVPSPAMPWGGANVSYAFYLVDENGKPLLANGNQAENFLTAYKVTQPVLYKTINLNAGETVLSAIGKEVLPYGYELYDATAAYTVTVQSGDGQSNWVIAYDTDKVQSTYVMGYAGAQDYSSAVTANNDSYDYTHTTVYFAVKWNIGTVPDAVVIDYGLPVDISVLANDMFGENGALAGVGLATNMPTSHTAQMDENFVNSVDKAHGTAYGTASVNGDKVNYVLDAMTMDKPEKLAYAVNYTGTTNPGYYYGEVTVIPATTVYFEDDFVTFSGSDANGNATSNVITEIPDSGMVAGQWYLAPDGSVSSETQDEDRPGEYSLSNIDANNVYGYDSAYTSFSKYSLGSAAKVHVDANSYAIAFFNFYGTGFDVISLTSNTTGTLIVNIKNATTGEVKNLFVDTYYGYSYSEAEGWHVDANNPNALYQVPVIKATDLGYGHYEVEIRASYNSFFDHTTPDGYDLYLDAIRIYDPTGNQDSVANEAYVADGEGWPTYIELRNNVIAAETFNNGDTEEANGLIFIDGSTTDPDGKVSIADYTSYGPNNELYLAAGQSIAFKLDQTNAKIIADVQIGLKSADGNAVTYKIYNANTTTAAAATAKTVNTATDMYYSIKNLASGTIVITNTGSSGILSITNIKTTYTQDPYGTTGASLLMDDESAGIALMSLRSAPVVEEEVPETTVPETTVPEETETETTTPEETEPETSAPEESEPKDEETKPSKPGKPDKEDKPNRNEEMHKQLKKAAEKIKNFVTSLLGKWFR